MLSFLFDDTLFRAFCVIISVLQGLLVFLLPAKRQGLSFPEQKAIAFFVASGTVCVQTTLKSLIREEDSLFLMKTRCCLVSRNNIPAVFLCLIVSK